MYKRIFDERKSGSSWGQLSKKYNKARSSIRRIVESFSKQKQKRGPKPLLKKMDKYHMKVLIGSHERQGIKNTISKIKEAMKLNVSNMTIWRQLRSLDFNYEKVFKIYKLNKEKRERRMLVARSYIENEICWKEVIFSDEKLFTINGNDSYFTWRLKGTKFFKKNNYLKSPGLMIWAAIFPNGTLSFRIISGSIKSKNYIDILKNSLIPMMKLNAKSNFYFQQDNCRVHTSRETLAFLKSSNVKVLEWAPYSPDLNIIENIWAELSRKVYGSGTIKNLRDLKTRIIQAFEEYNLFKTEYTKALYSSMPRRICDILLKKGDRVR